jgi:hypothetical protein
VEFWGTEEVCYDAYGEEGVDFFRIEDSGRRVEERRVVMKVCEMTEVMIGCFVICTMLQKYKRFGGYSARNAREMRTSNSEKDKHLSYP